MDMFSWCASSSSGFVYDVAFVTAQNTRKWILIRTDCTGSSRWIIRICNEWEVWIDKSVPRVTVWHHEALPSDAKQWPEGQIYRSMPLTNDRFFFLHTFLCKSLNKLQFYLKIRHTLTSAILFWRHFMALLWRALATMLRDVHYNQY